MIVLIAAVFAVLTGLLVIIRMVSRTSMKSAHLGRMSEQWLAEHRQSHSQ